MQTVTFHTANPMAGTWEVDVELNLTTSGKEFTQTVVGDVLPQAPAIASPIDGSNAASQTPTISGTGAAGDTVTVWDGGTAVCTATVSSDGTWSCAANTLPAGAVTLTATQADQTNDPSLTSNSITFNVPAVASVVLALDPQAPTPRQPVTLTAATANVPDGTTVSFADNGNTIGSGSDSGDTTTLSLPGGLGVGTHSLTASVPATNSSMSATSAAVDLVVSKTRSTIALHLARSTVVYGHSASGTVSVSGADRGTAVVTVGGRRLSVPIDDAGNGSFRLPATLSVGKHTISAVYKGTATVARSNTVTAILAISKSATTTNVSLSRTTIKHGAKASVTVHISGHAGALYPSGKVTVTATVGGRSTSTTATIRQFGRGSRPVTITLPNKTGTGHVVASYGGNRNFAASTSAPKSVNVV
jgi:hypothetical protein